MYFKILESLSIAVGSLENICCVDRLFVGFKCVSVVLVQFWEQLTELFAEGICLFVFQWNSCLNTHK